MQPISILAPFQNADERQTSVYFQFSQSTLAFNVLESHLSSTGLLTSVRMVACRVLSRLCNSEGTRMRLRIRTLLLTVALLCGMTSTASACLPPILNPFCWLFGCGYGYGGYGYGGYGYGGYGYDQGYGYGYSANPYATYRIIDDWLGYGYLRNQEGTLGHYPGRPFSCYRPWFPGLFNPCPPPVPAFAMPGPMVAPMPMQMPMQMPTMHNPCWDPCQDPCTDSCAPTPMVQCQPAPVPVTTWRPVTVDRGNWQMVWVPRPVTTMVPQTQYISPPAMMDSGCGDGCVGDSGSMMPGMMPGMSSEAGCCGSDNMLPQMQPSSGMPQSTMMYPGNMSMPQSYAMSPYGSMNSWSPTQGSMAWSPMGPAAAGGYPVSAYQPAYSFRQMRPAMVRRQVRRAARYYRHHGGPFAPAYPYPAMSTTAWPQPVAAQLPYEQPMYPQPAYGQLSYSQPQQFAWNAAPMAAQWTPQVNSPMPAQMTWSMQRAGDPGMNMMAGDIMGDHEMTPMSTAAIPIHQNSYSGPTPFMPANLSRPVQTISTNRYPNAVR